MNLLPPYIFTNMVIYKNILLLVTVLLGMSCTGDPVDDQKPQIDMSWVDAFPVNCDTVFIGETFQFRAKFTDNVQLGSFSIDIHHNFDHHSHSTEVTTCELLPVKQAVNPFVYINEFDIPEGLKEYTAEITIAVPDEVDEGDYHFFISLTDREGWRAEKGISIQIR